jgi:hypothetical protein
LNQERSCFTSPPSFSVFLLLYLPSPLKIIQGYTPLHVVLLCQRLEYLPLLLGHINKMDINAATK